MCNKSFAKNKSMKIVDCGICETNFRHGCYKYPQDISVQMRQIMNETLFGDEGYMLMKEWGDKFDKAIRKNRVAYRCALRHTTRSIT